MMSANIATMSFLRTNELNASSGSMVAANRSHSAEMDATFARMNAANLAATVTPEETGPAPPLSYGASVSATEQAAFAGIGG
jgi:hypothetical protein